VAKKENIKNQVVIRIYIGFLMICLLGAAIIAKAFYVQSVKGKHYLALADSLRIYPVSIRADRGNIYSSDGSLLATSLPVFDLFIDFKAEGFTDEIYKKHIDSLAILMAYQFPAKSEMQYKKEFAKNRAKGNRYYSLQRNVPFDVLNSMKTWIFFKRGKNKSGLIEEYKEKRDHPYGGLALRTVGIDENLDGIYSSGIELKYNDFLQGSSGKKLVQKVGAGVVRPLDTKEDIAPKPGRDIYTTLDITIQDVAHDALRRALIKHKADHGCVAVMEVKTGKIRALANLGRKDSTTYFEFLNYVVGEATEPGSTFKLATVAALMEDGFANKSTTVDCGNGTAMFKNLTIRDHEAPESPIMTIQKIIEVSSNVGVAKLASKHYAHQPKQFYNQLKKFGFADKVDVEVIGASSPVLAKPEKWSGVSIPFISHGYELRITPLHTLQFYNTIANNGKWVKPTLVEKITHYAQTIDSTRLVSKQILSEKTVKDLHEILDGVVEQGTAINLKTDYLRIAGKTGTAKIAQKNKGYKEDIYQASFCGYFPSENPEYSIIVVINSPSAGGYYGNVVAGTIFREVADKIYSRNLKPDTDFLNTKLVAVAPNIKQIDKQHLEQIFSYLGVAKSLPDAEWVKQNGQGMTSVNISEKQMPDMSGLSLRDAIFIAESIGLKVAIEGKGKVISQSIQPGENIRKGLTLKIVLS
jgi:cell division protein FtsI (penicillin-binding protein 3)